MVNRIITLLVITIIVIGLTDCSNAVSEESELITEIAEGIKVPFQHVDTVIYDPNIGIDLCGNSPQSEREKYFHPQLSTPPYIDLLKNNNKEIIQFVDDELALKIERCEDSLTFGWDCFIKDKVVLTITGEILSKDSVRIIEVYRRNDDYYRTDKLFWFSFGQWTYKVTDVAQAF